MKNGKFIVARMWPYYTGGNKLRLPAILGIKPEKYETIFIYLKNKGTDTNIFAENGKKVYYLSDSKTFFKPLGLLKLVSILKEEKVDILHCHMHKATVYGAIAAKIAKVPAVLSHVHGLHRTGNLRRKLLNYFILKDVKKILTVGQAVKDDVIRTNYSVNPEKVVNVGNSIPFDFYSEKICDKETARKKFNIPLNSTVFGTAGRLAHNKGHSYLISAFEQIKKTFPNAKLLIAGNGEFKESLEKQILQTSCRDCIHLLGQVNNMREFYSSLDLFVLPSTGSEGLPRVLLEAMASEVLVISTNVGGTSEILDNGRLGQIIPPKDINALAEAMVKSVNMPENQRQKMIIEAKEYVKINFSHPAMIKKIEEIYDILF